MNRKKNECCVKHDIVERKKREKARAFIQGRTYQF